MNIFPMLLECLRALMNGGYKTWLYIAIYDLYKQINTKRSMNEREKKVIIFDMVKKK